MKDLLIAPSVTDIIPVALVFFGIGFVLYRFKELSFSVREWVVVALLSVMLTAASLTFGFEDGCGTRLCYYRGWPHTFFMSYQSLESAEHGAGFQFGQFGVYLMSNFLFYGSLVFMAASAIKGRT